jgi:hypothetical protein
MSGCMQDVNTKQNFTNELLTFRGFNIQQNEEKARVAIYIYVNISYNRSEDLEGINNNMIINKAPLLKQ